MRIPRLYYPHTLALEDSLYLDRETSHHVGTVLRLRKGEWLCLFNGEPYEYQGLITDPNPKKITLQIQNRIHKDLRGPLAIHLGQSVVKGHRMDFVMQKATELGVQRITPLVAERSLVLADERLEKKQSHWQKIIIHAAEQCGRTDIPLLEAPIPLCAWMDARTETSCFILDPLATQGLSTGLTGLSAALLIGPEGGLSPKEQAYAKAQGFQGLRLGPRILRTETAALAALVALQCQMGDFRYEQS